MAYTAREASIGRELKQKDSFFFPLFLEWFSCMVKTAVPPTLDYCMSETEAHTSNEGLESVN